jgi:4,5-DOPA dioxygenase extradiol
MNTSAAIPALFLSHGPPAIAVKDCPARRFLMQLGRMLPRPVAIIAISAHWESVAPLVTGEADPGIVHDFGGPPALRGLAYGLKGAPELAKEAIALLERQGLSAQEQARPFDHGTWIPLMLIYPEADIPALQLSIQTEENPEHHYQVGRALAPLRESGVLIMASGGAVHNLDEAWEHAFDDAPPAYVRHFDRWLEETIVNGRRNPLLDYSRQAPDPQRCHPYPAEHLLPLFVALGAADGGQGRRLHGSFLMGTLSMAAYLWD